MRAPASDRSLTRLVPPPVIRHRQGRAELVSSYGRRAVRRNSTLGARAALAKPQHRSSGHLHAAAAGRAGRAAPWPIPRVRLRRWCNATARLVRSFAAIVCSGWAWQLRCTDLRRIGPARLSLRSAFGNDAVVAPGVDVAGAVCLPGHPCVPSPAPRKRWPAALAQLAPRAPLPGNVPAALGVLLTCCQLASSRTPQAIVWVGCRLLRASTRALAATPACSLLAAAPSAAAAACCPYLNKFLAPRS